MNKTFIYHSQYPNRWSDQFIKCNVTLTVKDNEAYGTNGKKVRCIKLERIKAIIDHEKYEIVNKKEWGQYLTYEIYE